MHNLWINISLHLYILSFSLRNPSKAGYIIVVKLLKTQDQFLGIYSGMFYIAYLIVNNLESSQYKKRIQGFIICHCIIILAPRISVFHSEY